MTHPDVRERLERVARDGLGSIRRHGMTQDDLRELLDSAAKAEAEVGRLSPPANEPKSDKIRRLQHEIGQRQFELQNLTFGSMTSSVSGSAVDPLASIIARALTTPSAGGGE